MEEEYVVLRIEGAPGRKPSGLQELAGMRDLAAMQDLFKAKDLAGGRDRAVFKQRAGLEELAGVRTRTARAPIGAPAPVEAAPRPKVLVERTTLTENQRREAAKDPRNTIAPTFPIVRMAEIGPEQDIGRLAGDPVAEARTTGRPWGIDAVGAEKPFLDGAAAGVMVAVIDSGIDRKHPAFAGLDLTVEDFTKPPDAANPDAAGGDAIGHGTFCASVIFGRSVEGVRIGVAPAIRKALVAKVFDDAGASSTQAVLGALAWVHKKRANIVSLSLAFDFAAMFRQLKDNGFREEAAFSEAIVRYQQAVAQFSLQIEMMTMATEEDPGMVVIAAAGNESRRNDVKPYNVRTGIPAAVKFVLSVGAVGRAAGGHIVPPFSNINPMVVAPGVQIVGARAGKRGPESLGVMDGTSLACPHVAGVAALWWGHVAEQTGGHFPADQITSTLRGLARFLPGIEPALQGSGLVCAPSQN